MPPEEGASLKTPFCVLNRKSCGEYSSVRLSRNFLVGRKAPDFCLPDQNGRKHCLKDHLKKGGCTIEAQQFTSLLSFYEKQNVSILGVSPDTAESHKKFEKKYGLKIAVLSDPDKTVIKKYGAWGKKLFMGKAFEGVLRTTFVISPSGVIQFVFESVKPEGHAAEVLGKVGECKLKELAEPVRPLARKTEAKVERTPAGS
ncbi:peroxiredoxin [Candidatus Micrarchaeota archaeon]|nr:peroxiredoxin [Candidatus Micrarchaeota archaeon]